MDSFTFSMMQLDRGAPRRKIVVMGVSGSGKTTIGGLLARRLGAVFLEGDDFHPSANVEKMRKGIPLGDIDRWPWLDRFGIAMADADGDVVGACSALKRSYRDRIRGLAGKDVRFVLLKASEPTLAARLNSRPGHFMPATLLASQLATLEPLGNGEENSFAVDAEHAPDAVLEVALACLKSGRESAVADATGPK